MLEDVFGKHIPWENPNAVAVRNYLRQTCIEFNESGLADSKFSRELNSGEVNKFWSCISEAFVAKLLADKNFVKRPSKGAASVGDGPDFLVLDNERKVWIEVVCPEPKGLSDEWLNPDYSTPTTGALPDQQLLLRWTSAISTKAAALKKYITKGVVGPGDGYVIAVNACCLRSGPLSALTGISQFPYAVQAALGVGPYQVTINPQQSDALEKISHEYRPDILNKNEATVSTSIFLTDEFSAISAIWALDLNGTSVIGNSQPKSVVHNPYASVPLTKRFLPSDTEYTAVINENQIEIIQCA